MLLSKYNISGGSLKFIFFIFLTLKKIVQKYWLCPQSPNGNSCDLRLFCCHIYRNGEVINPGFMEEGTSGSSVYWQIGQS